MLQISPIYQQHHDISRCYLTGDISAIYRPDIFPNFLAIFSRFYRNICQFYCDICRFLTIFANFFKYIVIFFFFVFFNIFVFFYIADILPMFADIFVDKSDNFFLDPWRYIRRHDICNIDVYNSFKVDVFIISMIL